MIFLSVQEAGRLRQKPLDSQLIRASRCGRSIQPGNKRQKWKVLVCECWQVEAPLSAFNSSEEKEGLFGSPDEQGGKNYTYD